MLYCVIVSSLTSLYGARCTARTGDGCRSTSLNMMKQLLSVWQEQDPDGAVDISVLGVALAAALIVFQALVSVRLSLGLHTQLVVAAIRCIVQLSLLGYILVPIFRLNQPWLVLLYASFMIWVSAVEAIGRPAKRYKGMFLHTWLIIAVCSSSVMAWALLLVIGIHPWWSAQYLIPILGMVLGNTISGISVGLSSVMEELNSGADRIEKLLALGASRSEATQDLLSRSVRLAMTPLLNQMSVVGLVSIPGMMTGQILGGSNPDQAARYQMVIMFLLGATATAAAVCSTTAAVYVAVDSCHRLRPERLVSKGKAAGVNGAITFALTKLWHGVVRVWRGVLGCFRWICCCYRRRKGLEDDDGWDERQSRLAASSAGQHINESRQPLLRHA